jgi:Rab GDP dissociation inhibitor
MNITSKELIMDEHWCSENTTEFIGHCIALHQDNLYLNQPAIHTVHNMRKYAKSLAKYDEGNSPFIYPEYGLGGLSEAFARICSINGGDFILGRDIHDNDFIVNNTGNEKKIQVSCINSETKIIEGCTVNAIVGDPSYFNDNKRMQQGSIIRCICLLRGRVEGLPDENVQIIYPQGQCIPKRQNDIYISIIGSSFKCTPDNSNIWCATMSTIIENQNNPFSELSNAMKLVGGDANIIDSFYEVTPYYVPLEDDENDDNIYVSKSVDATTHFESITLDVISLYERITGEKLQFDKDGSEEKEGNGETKK